MALGLGISRLDGGLAIAGLVSGADRSDKTVNNGGTDKRKLLMGVLGSSNGWFMISFLPSIDR